MQSAVGSEGGGGRGLVDVDYRRGSPSGISKKCGASGEPVSAPMRYRRRWEHASDARDLEVDAPSSLLAMAGVTRSRKTSGEESIAAMCDYLIPQEKKLFGFLVLRSATAADREERVALVVVCL